MTPHEKILTAATAMVVLVAVIGLLFHWYVCAVEWWPLVGREWRAEKSWNRQCDAVEIIPDDELIVVPDREPDWEPEPDENWIEDLPPERPLELVREPVIPVLSDDPDLIVWDARRQAERCWEIVHVEFPRLRASILEQYRLAAAA